MIKNIVRENKMTVIHLRDTHLPRQPLHFESRKEHLQLTDDPKLVTCKRCLAMIKRAEKKRAEAER